MNLQKKAVEYFLVEYSTTFLHRRLYSYSSAFQYSKCDPHVIFLVFFI